MSPLAGERLLVRGVELPAVELEVERTELDARRPHGSGVRIRHVGHHAEEAPCPFVAATAEECRRTLVTDEVRDLQDDSLVVRPVRAELQRAALEQPEEKAPRSAPGQLGMHVRVADEPPALPVEQVSDSREPAVELDEPRVPVEVEALPVLAQLARGPVGRPPDGGVRRLEQRERLGEALVGRSRDDHRAHPRRALRRAWCGRPYCSWMRVRPMATSDWPAVARIYAAGLAGGVATFETDVPAWEAWDAAHLEHPRLVAEDEERVMGWVAVSRVSRRPAYRGVVEHSVYVDERARGRGVGRALLEALIAAAPAHGIWTIQTSIIDANGPSLRLHEAVGFRVVGRRERIARRDGVWRDTLLLELRLP